MKITKFTPKRKKMKMKNENTNELTFEGWHSDEKETFTGWRNDSDGRIFRDEDNNVLSIASKKLDLDKIRIITEAAAHFGQPKGDAVFLPGAIKATEEEHREQVDRMKAGLIPTMNDFGAVTDAKVAGRARGEKVGE